MQSPRFHVILNANSGTALATGLDPLTLEQRLVAAGIDAGIDADVDVPLRHRIARARRSGAEVIVAAGGDGTATAIAGAIVGTGQALAILPLGTANLLARDLGLPLDLDAAIAGLAALSPRRIDVGEVNGQVFLHKVVIGLVPGIAAAREQLRGRSDWRALFGFLGHFLRRLERARRIAVEITPRDGVPRIERLQSIAVANNDYDEGPGRIFSRARLDGGSLSLYVIRHLSWFDVLRLSVRMLLGRWRQDAAIEIENVAAVTLRTRRKRLKAMVDGEIETLTVPLRFRIRPAALTVMAPAAAETAAPEPDQTETPIAPLVAIES